jgi:H+/gluconate symporter-like permease
MGRAGYCIGLKLIQAISEHLTVALMLAVPTIVFAGLLWMMCARVFVRGKPTARSNEAVNKKRAPASSARSMKT